MKSILPSRPLFYGAPLCAVLLILGTPPTHAGAPDSVMVFGDSAADQGNLNATPGYAPGPNAPYYRGPDGLLRLSNGPMWTERLFPSLQAISAPGAVGTDSGGQRQRNINFAYGAATTGKNSFGAGEAGELPVGVESQVSAYLALRGSAALPPPGQNSYAFIEAGPNDYFESLANGENLAATAVQSPRRLTDAARRLAKAGIHTVFVTETPDFADAPLFIDAGLSPEQRAALNRFAATSRVHLRTELGQLQAELGDSSRVVVMPANALFRAILAHPGEFGFTNVTGKLYDDTADALLERDAAKQDCYLFVDSLHLTSKAQAWQAHYYSEIIGAIDGTAHQRFARITDGLRHTADLFSSAAASSMAGPVSRDRWTWFASARGGSAWGEGETAPEWRSAALTSLIGARRSVTSQWDLGLALGSFLEDGKLSPRSLRWENEGHGLWFLNTWNLGGTIVRLDLGATRLNTETTRDPSIPTFVARGDTSGYLLSSRLEVERPIGQISRSIQASVVLGTRFSRSRLKAFDESAADGLNLHVDKIERDSIRSDAGLRLRGTRIHIGTLTFEPSADFLLNYETGDRSTDVTTQLLENSAAPVRVAVPNGSRTQGAVRFNLGVAITPTLHALFTDAIEVHSSDQYEHRVQLGLSASF